MKICKLFLGVVVVLGTTAGMAERVPPGTDEEIAERLEPFGDVCRTGEECASPAAGDAEGDTARSGQQVYDQFCGICHRTGVAEAPVLGDAEAWDPRLEKGMDTLWQHTLNGFNAMPPKGTCMDCSDDELRAAMDYMVEQVQ